MVTSEELACSLFLHQKTSKPCIVYSHSHSGNRLEGASLSEALINDFNYCVFDYSGYGKSQGHFTTLGIKEQDDLEAVIHHLRNYFKMQTIYIWGRSMGAVTALLLAARTNNWICDAMVLDAPFLSTRKMVTCRLLALQRSSKHPEFLTLCTIHAPRIKAKGNNWSRCAFSRPNRYCK